MTDNIDSYLDSLLGILSETINRLSEAPGDNSAAELNRRQAAQGPISGGGPVPNSMTAPRNYAGFSGPQAPPQSIQAGGPAAVQRWHDQMAAIGAGSSRAAPGGSNTGRSAPRPAGGGGRGPGGGGQSTGGGKPALAGSDFGGGSAVAPWQNDIKGTPDDSYRGMATKKQPNQAGPIAVDALNRDIAGRTPALPRYGEILPPERTPQGQLPGSRAPGSTGGGPETPQLTGPKPPFMQEPPQLTGPSNATPGATPPASSSFNPITGLATSALRYGAPKLAGAVGSYFGDMHSANAPGIAPGTKAPSQAEADAATKAGADRAAHPEPTVFGDVGNKSPTPQASRPPMTAQQMYGGVPGQGTSNIGGRASAAPTPTPATPTPATPSSTSAPSPSSPATAGSYGGNSGGKEIMSSKGWGLTWSDYNVLHESDTKQRRIRGY